MTDVSLRDFVERILSEHDKAHAAQHEAVTIAAKELERRLEVLNHAHEQSLEDRRDFVTVDKFETRTEAVDQRLKALENFRSKATGVAIVLTLFAGAVGAAIVKVLGG